MMQYINKHFYVLDVLLYAVQRISVDLSPHLPVLLSAYVLE